MDAPQLKILGFIGENTLRAQLKSSTCKCGPVLGKIAEILKSSSVDVARKQIH